MNVICAPARSITLDVNAVSVSALLLLPKRPRACFVFAHGAGADMSHVFMEDVAQRLALRAIGTLRYQFPYMQRGGRRPDPPPQCHATVRAAVREATRHTSGISLVAGGKSFGGRMTSQAQAAEPLPGIRGLAFFGFPLHPAGKPAALRAAHLQQIGIPMLFMQGTRDALAHIDLLAPLIETLGAASVLVAAPGADHSFHVRKGSGVTDAQIMDVLVDRFSNWIDTL